MKKNHSIAEVFSIIVIIIIITSYSSQGIIIIITIIIIIIINELNPLLMEGPSINPYTERNQPNSLYYLTYLFKFHSNILTPIYA